MKSLKISKFVFVAFFFALFVSIFTANKPLYLLPDMPVYYDLYIDAIMGRDVVIEQSYVYLSLISVYLGLGFSFLIFMYAFLSIMIKVYALKQYKEKYTFAILYISSYLFLHELVQIRIGLAISVLFLGVFLYFENKKLAGVIVISLAPIIHQSTLMFPFVFYFSVLIVGLRLQYFILTASFLFFILSYDGLSVLESILNWVPISSIRYKILTYMEMQKVTGESINLFSIRFIIFYFTTFLLFLRWNALEYRHKVLLVLGVSFYTIVFIVRDLFIISLRIIEIAGPFYLLLMSSLRNYYRSKYINIVLCLFFFSSLYYSHELFIQGKNDFSNL
ncbi:EpsG family protein [Aeromonas sp. ASNIH5]|uniref:EpsG family protein n=1 Tax=Aeromonas sp. ASNIH5 TaxID=1758179 RepID=UPI000CD0E82E|nr:EpsG family protein [Aeromonas sp. ASNIH5]AUT44114.1 hypothetical protein C2U30_22205 [Aeromonas sp. ASNIH5]